MSTGMEEPEEPPVHVSSGISDISLTTAADGEVPLLMILGPSHASDDTLAMARSPTEVMSSPTDSFCYGNELFHQPTHCFENVLLLRQDLYPNISGRNT